MKEGKLIDQERKSIKAMIMADDGSHKIELTEEVEKDGEKKEEKVEVELFEYWDKILTQRPAVVDLSEQSKQDTDIKTEETDVTTEKG